ncbi:hypothetical protein [Bacillus sp. REN16]|uniref:hypothetical protein n=1 Tax=Bacillus sp. REN16 TaxID=2887296 RepID=UPI001E34DAB2|nr:hypothetical protein [Bacillus sp. REN16]MCC3358422.1 hypothetical protein [Bacillus sp. REN16]
MYHPNDLHREIGTAWYGRHVVLVTCNTSTNQFLLLHKSFHAPTEPPNPNCAETLSQFLSIGYKIAAIAPLSHSEIQYVLVK